MMCEPSTPHACATEEDDGAGAAVSQCRGATVPSDATRDDTTACLRGLVAAACGRVVDVTRDECWAEGRLVRDADAADAGLAYGAIVCNEVCAFDSRDDGDDGATAKALARVEVDVRCAPGEACAAGAVRRFAAGAEADERRRRSAEEGGSETRGLFPALDASAIAAAATPPPPALDSSQGYGLHHGR